MHRAETCRAKQERLNKPTIELRLEIQTKSVVVYATYVHTPSQATSQARHEASELPKGASRAGASLFLWGVSDWGVVSGCCSIRAAYRFSLVDLTLT